MTANSIKVLNTLKSHYSEGKAWLTGELAEAAGVSAAAVTGSVTGLVKKGLAERIPGTIKVEKDGEMIDKEVKFIKITPAGYEAVVTED